ncbi:MAG: hypothetical protein KGS47_05295 [Chloroflexi bacterium]|nr:hypothetical protein [Chloroflexota bacterium]
MVSVCFFCFETFFGLLSPMTCSFVLIDGAAAIACASAHDYTTGHRRMAVRIDNPWDASHDGMNCGAATGRGAARRIGTLAIALVYEMNDRQPMRRQMGAPPASGRMIAPVGDRPNQRDRR